MILTDPPSIDVGETTDKGYINQGAVLEARGDRVEELYRGFNGFEESNVLVVC